MRFDNALTRMLGVRYPIIQGAFGPNGMGTSAIAVPVSEAGGLGILTSLTFSTPDEFQEDIRKAKAATEKPFAVNFTVFKEGPGDNSYHEDYLKIALDEGIGTVFTSAYDGSLIGKRVKNAGGNWIHKCATLEHAVSTARKGVDAIVIVGIEGAGIKSPNQCSTLVNMTVARRLIDVPLIAAGGIGDARGFMSALSMGASGIYMGTAFMATREFQIPDGLKDRIVDQEILDAEYRNKVLRGERGNHPSLASGVVDSIPTVQEFIESLVAGAEEIVSELRQWGMLD
jgi:nitronate monooxygenase